MDANKLYTTAKEVCNCNASRVHNDVSIPVNELRVKETKPTAIVDKSLLKNVGIKSISSSLLKYCHNSDETSRMSSHKLLECSNAADCRDGRHCTSRQKNSYSAGQDTIFVVPTTSQEEYLAESMRICMDSINGMSSCAAGCPRFSQTTCSLLITEKTDGEQKVKLLPLSTSTHSEAEVNPGDAKASEDTMKNELSTKTDAMEIDSCMDDCLTADPGNRWIKRLKLSSSNSAQGTKSSSKAEKLPHNKLSNSYSRVSSITCSELTPRRYSSRVPPVSDIGGNFSKKYKGKTLLLSHAWIQRWLCKGSILTEKLPVACEPQCSKLAPARLQKEQVPSIAAMAMMGKAMAGCRQCDIHKKGAFTLWKTKAF